MNPLQISPQITAIPVVHGSGDAALEVRRRLLAGEWDGIAVALPPSFQDEVEAGILRLPALSLVMQREWSHVTNENWAEDAARPAMGEMWASVVPIEPCQGVIAALRFALEEHIPRFFLDCETGEYTAVERSYPDPYALKRVSLEQFAAAILPALAPHPTGRQAERMRHIAWRLRQLERQYRRLALVCSFQEWLWIRTAYYEDPQPADDDVVQPAELYAVQPHTALFMLWELPFIAGLYERARLELEADDNLSIDGVKQLLQASREAHQRRHGDSHQLPSLKSLQMYLQYVRNLALMHSRLTPTMYDLVQASRQMFGDAFTRILLQTMRQYPYHDRRHSAPSVTCSLGCLRLPSGEVRQIKSRLPGPPLVWKTLRLKPDEDVRTMRGQSRRLRDSGKVLCSWPPEDTRLETFRVHAERAALTLLGHERPRTEKFTTSLKDGLDLRETLRNWHTGQLFVREIPPSHGHVQAVVVFFEVPADPQRYTYRATWYAEHHNEAILSFYATDYRAERVGPNIGRAQHGGLFLLFPPRKIPDIWTDPRFDRYDTLETRLLAAACYHSQHPHVVLVSPVVPLRAWQHIARRFQRKLMHLPLRQFQRDRLAQLRIMHILQGYRTRRYAARYIDDHTP
ncbi:MAG: hypothetical protein KatS3mg114_0282 [Planctomycetaceae bacterium]|nr:MAG: hypothetical protein KatS3mg114_0282 [Planctomycetaceae bacterium]